MLVHFLHDFISGHSNLIGQSIFGSLQLAADFADQILVCTQHVLVLIEHLSVLHKGLCI